MLTYANLHELMDLLSCNSIVVPKNVLDYTTEYIHSICTSLKVNENYSSPMQIQIRCIGSSRQLLCRLANYIA